MRASRIAGGIVDLGDSRFQKGRVAAPGGPPALTLSAGAQALDFDNGAIH
jgi:hypothetical protein